MQLWEFVLTGGPCAGKTTALSVIEQVLSKKGFKVIIYPKQQPNLLTLASRLGSLAKMYSKTF